MESMINIFRRSFFLRQTLFTIKFYHIFPLFDLISDELDKILELKFKDKKINIIIINDENKQSTNENNLNNLNLPIEDSYDLDDIMGTNYIKRNPRRKFPFTNKSLNDQCFNIIPKLNSFDDLSSSESQDLSSEILNSKVILTSELPPLQENIIQISSVEPESICNTLVVEQISSEQNVESDIKMKSDNISQSVKIFTEYEDSTVTPLKIEYTDLKTTTTEATEKAKEVTAIATTEESTSIATTEATEKVTIEEVTAIATTEESASIATTEEKAVTATTEETTVASTTDESSATATTATTTTTTTAPTTPITPTATSTKLIKTDVLIEEMLPKEGTEETTVTTTTEEATVASTTEETTLASTTEETSATATSATTTTTTTAPTTPIATSTKLIKTDVLIEEMLPKEPIKNDVLIEQMLPKEVTEEIIATAKTATTTTITIAPTTPTNKLIKNYVLIEEIPSKEVITSQEIIISLTSREVVTQEIITSREVITPQKDITSTKSITSQEMITSKEIVISLKDKRVTSQVPLSFNANIPIDIFIEICYHLPPTSLFSLMCVCKQFRFWLNSSVSYITQDIWRTSRMKYLERIKLRPPVGMDELSYIKLAMLEHGCQFCGTKDETPKVYWAFRVRCCLACLKKRVTSPENLPKWAKSPVDITMLVSYETIDSFDSNGKTVIYWNSQLEQTRRECMSTPPKHRSAWIQKKKHWVSEMLKEVVKRERIDELYCRKQSLEDERIFRTLLDEFRQIKDEKGQQRYIDKYILQLPTYLEGQNTWKIPFMTNPWPNFIDRLKIEYPKIINKVTRIQQLTDTMLTLITSYVTLASDLKVSSEQGYQIYLTDPVIDCIQWCPSFINPPYVKNDASIPWTEEYLIKTLIPKLRREARRLLKRSDIKRPGPFTSVRGCKNLIKNEVEDKEYFMCKLCWKSARKIYTYEGICRHLTSGRHSIARIDDERMIEVDREKVKKLLPVWFSNFH
ncbi:18524_t:CDS:2 [Rhizophagus irregularis]|nr:18524_t:CDS:2 [Rhizophagus irregularis]